MLPDLSLKIVSFFTSIEIVRKEDQEVYAYGVELLLATVINFIILCILAVITGTIMETALFLLSFLPLRQLVGGYHAKNHLRCFLILISVYMIFVLALSIIITKPVLTVIIGVILLASYIIIIKYAPVADDNKPLSTREFHIIKRKGRIAISAYTVITGVLLLFPIPTEWVFSISFGILSVALSVLAGIIKLKLKGHNLLNNKS